MAPMKTCVWRLILVGLLGINLHALAADSDKVVISAQKKRAESDQGHVGAEGSKAKSSEKDFFELKVQNQTLSDLASLKVDYVIFIERQKLRKKLTHPSRGDRVSGTKARDRLTDREPQSGSTD